jgi:hypothetical protein
MTGSVVMVNFDVSLIMKDKIKKKGISNFIRRRIFEIYGY